MQNSDNSYADSKQPNRQPENRGNAGFLHTKPKLGKTRGASAVKKNVISSKNEEMENYANETSIEMAASNPNYSLKQSLNINTKKL